MWDEKQFEEYQARQSDRARVHYASPLPAVTIPILQSLISGVLVALCAGTLAWLGDKNPFTVFLVAFVLTVTASWFLNLRRWAGIVNQLERLTGIDLNRNGVIDAQPVKQVVRVEVKQGNQTSIAEMPASREKLADLARGILSGLPFSESQWSGSGALLSRGEFRAIRDTMVARGWLRWKDPAAPQQGLELTGPGKAVLRAFASETASPTPRIEGE